MIQTVLLSTRTAAQFAVLYLMMLSLGIQLGLNTDGPFGYLEAQHALLDTKETMIQQLAPMIELVPWTKDIATTGIELAMRGVTLGHNAPHWLTAETVIATVAYLGIAMLIIFTRAWRYTTTTHIK